MSQAPDDDDDRTVLRTPLTASLRTGASATVRLEPGPDDEAHCLRPGVRVGEFEITRRLGEGGFSVVYLAWDHSLERSIALKEYMPASLARRVNDTRIVPRSERDHETFEAGLRSFINEGKLLAQFDHPSLVKVYRFWEANGTAYMIMPFYAGRTLKDTVRALDQPPDEHWLLTLLDPLTQALAVIHAEHCYHRDIAPDNVMLLEGDGRPLLLDFGAARRVIGDMTHALTVILKPGYAPVEQYAEVPGMNQGAWTDVYALCAVVYWTIMGKTPPVSVGRMMRDSHVPLATAAAGRYSNAFLEAIDAGLQVLPDQRTQSIAALRQQLNLDGGASPRNRSVDPEATVQRGVATGAARVDAATSSWRKPASTGPARQTGPSLGKDRRHLVAGGLGLTAAAVVAVAGGLWWASTTHDVAAPSRVTPPVAASSPVSVPAPVDVPATKTPTPPVAEPPAVAPASVPAPVEPTAAASSVPASRPPPRATAAVPSSSKKSTPSAPAPATSSECAQLVARMSLGDTSAALQERLRTLNCR